MRTIDIQGHRGARGLMPENTLPAFAQALQIGVTTLELDCAVTRDGVLVASHDRRLNPDITRRDGKWLESMGPAIRSLSYDELANYDVGAIRPDSPYFERFSAQTPMENLRIPRLTQIFDLVAAAGATTMRFNIETKLHPLRPEESLPPGPFAEALVAVVRDAGLADRCSIQSFDWRTLATVQAIAPEISTVYLSVQQSGDDTIGTASKTGSPWTNRIRYAEHGSVPRMVAAAGGRIWSPHQSDLSPELLAEAHALGLQVVVWTVNDAAGMESLIDMGVDGIITDYPNRLRVVAERKGLALPPQYPDAKAP